MLSEVSLKENYWNNFTFQDSDLDFVYNQLLESETPQTTAEILKALISERISQEKEKFKNQKAPKEKVYLPKDEYEVGQKLVFPALDNQKGEVTEIREGNNPQFSPFKVIKIKLESGETKEFASNFEPHELNDAPIVPLDDSSLDPNYVLETFGKILNSRLFTALETNPDIIRIAGRWFPEALLVDVNAGYLNLAEAVLDMENGGPLTTSEILSQIGLPTDVNAKLTEFSLNYALQEDPRFDEVGPAGITLWFLNKLEPAKVKEMPIHLEYNKFEYSFEQVESLVGMLSSEIADELEPEVQHNNSDEFSFSLIYPHWRSGTLPLTESLCKFFPTAYESPRIRFDFIDDDSGKKFAGWVSRQKGYVYGLDEWYNSNEVLPGSLITIKKSSVPGEVIIHTDKRHPTREWVRTAQVGSDGKLAISMLKQLVSTAYDDRMLIVVPDPDALDKIRTSSNLTKNSLDKIVVNLLRDLSKLSPQGHVHAEELYAAVNLVHRCPPGCILSILLNDSRINHLGDLYFRLEEAIGEE